MTAYVLRRLGWGVVVVFIVLTMVFLLTRAVGDPAAATLGPRAGAEQLAQFRRQHDLDKPIHVQYGNYMWALVTRGDLGRSFRDERPVGEVIMTRLPRTILLGTMAMGIELTIGLLVGLFAAVKRNTWFDTGFMALAFVGISAPTFITGLLFLRYVAFGYGFFPVGGYGIDFWDHVWHAFLPALTLAIIGAATYARIMRSEMLDTLRADYIRTARAKGVGPFRVIFAHGARNALLPIVTLMGMQLTTLVSGAIITEQIYAWPGMGRLAIESINAVDAPMIIGIVLVVSITVQIGNLIGDLAVAALDPRIRAEK